MISEKEDKRPSFSSFLTFPRGDPWKWADFLSLALAQHTNFWLRGCGELFLSGFSFCIKYRKDPLPKVLLHCEVMVEDGKRWTGYIAHRLCPRFSLFAPSWFGPYDWQTLRSSIYSVNQHLHSTVEKLSIFLQFPSTFELIPCPLQVD